ncbi:MAG: M48 family metalloprotease [Rhodocyclales bacterium]|nr:M48 family metalloprotease [Rhodocyclales bacterium]
MPRILFSLVMVIFLTACATSPEGRTQLLAPSPLQGFSAVYSEFDMHLKLVTAADAPSCREAECAADRSFDQRILALGRRLAEVAYRQNADLYLRFPRFEFIVADKADAGATSSAGGAVVIYRGVRRLDLDDAALAFVLAREMSHVIAGHHDENVTTSVLVAVAAQILLPVLNVARGAAAAFSGSAATTAATTTAASAAVTTTAMASAASFAGSRALRASYRPQQVREAETIAMKLLAAAGWDGREVSDQLQALRPALPEEPDWTEELRESTRRIASAMQGPVLPETPGTMGALGQIAPALPSDLPPPLVSRPY